MKFHYHQAKRNRLVARCGGVMMAMVCGANQADAATGFGGETDLPGDTLSGTPDLGLPLMRDDQAFDFPMPDDPDAEWIDMDATQTPETPVANDLVSLFDGALTGSLRPMAFRFRPWRWVVFPGSPIDRLRQGIGLALSVTGTYDSNPSRRCTGKENDGAGDFSLMFGGGVSYLSRSST